ncbi:hypothetical protein DTB58_37140 [Streptomyces griseus]|nr:hypothetical protein [Streptomyces griseus]
MCMVLVRGVAWLLRLGGGGRGAVDAVCGAVGACRSGVRGACPASAALCVGLAVAAQLEAVGAGRAGRVAADPGA